MGSEIAPYKAVNQQACQPIEMPDHLLGIPLSHGEYSICSPVSAPYPHTAYENGFTGVHARRRKKERIPISQRRTIKIRDTLRFSGPTGERPVPVLAVKLPPMSV